MATKENEMLSESQNIEYKESWRDENPTKQELKGLALQQFIMNKMGHSWDDIPVYGATIDDIDRNAIDFFLRCSIKAGRMDEEEANASTESVLRNLGLFTNDGELKNADLMRKHSSFPRNHNIANVFYKAGFVESWGRGFKKISEEFEKAKMPLPTIEENGGGVMATILRKTVDDMIAERGGNVGDFGGNSGGKIMGNVGNLSETNVGNDTD